MFAIPCVMLMSEWSISQARQSVSGREGGGLPPCITQSTGGVAAVGVWAGWGGGAEVDAGGGAVRVGDGMMVGAGGPASTDRVCGTHAAASRRVERAAINIRDDIGCSS